jgi:hypothetical protein
MLVDVFGAAKFRSVAAACLVVLLVLVAPLHAQEGAASINGTVTDQSGALIPGARVVLTSAETGQSRETVTVDNGTYVFPLLPVGTYSLTCSRNGFKAETRPSVTITADERATVDFSLEVGQVNQSVEVAASAERLNTTNGTLGQVVQESTMVELPLNGRNPADLVFLAPGAIDGVKAGVFNRSDFVQFPNAGGASVNGGRQMSTYYMIDGANNVDNNMGLAHPFPNPDATQEFQVITNNFDAQYGFSGGAVVSVVTRSGSNAWHGDGFEFLRNDALNARDFFAHTRDTLKRNQFGGSIGGSIVKNKLFIFGNYQGTIEHYVNNAGSAYVPNNEELQGNFTQLLTGQITNPCGANGPASLNFDTGQIFDPATPSFFTCPAGSGNAGQQIVVRQPFAGNVIDTARFSPISMKFEQVLPQTDDPNGLVSLAGAVARQNYNEFTIRPDWYASPQHHISGRVFYDKFNHPSQTGGGDILLADRSWPASYWNYGGNWVYTIRANLLNNLVISENHFADLSHPGYRTKDGGPVCYSCFGVNVVEPTSTPPGMEYLATNGFSAGENTNDVNSDNMTISESITWTRGKHMIVAGVDILRQNWVIGTDWLALPLFGFDGQFSGSDRADFLLGEASYFAQGAGQFMGVKGTSWAPFGQDTVRLRPNLSINVGVRWEPYLPGTPEGGKWSDFRPGQQSTRYPNAPLGLVFPGDAHEPDSASASSLPVFSPRVSVAWQPRALPNTSIRAAFGMFTSVTEYSTLGHAASTAPFSPSFYVYPTTTGGPTVPGGTPIPFADPWSVFVPTGGMSPFPPFSSANYSPPASSTFVTPVSVGASYAADFKPGRIQSWNLSIEHEFPASILFRVAYIGSEGYHLQTILERNPGIYSTNANLNGLRTEYPNFGSVLDYVSWSTSSYNGLQFTLDKKFSHGLQVTSNYAWSKSIDSTTQYNSSFNSSIPDPFNLAFNRGLSDLNRPQIWTTSWVYQLPDLKSHSIFTREVLGGWQLSGIWRLQSGDPFSIVGGYGDDASQTHIGADRADLTGQPLDVRQGSKNQWLNQYFNPAAFAPNGPGTFGNSPRNLLQGPGVNNADLGISKNFPFRERYRIQFRWEMFNAFNRADFSNPNHDPTATGAFGTITSTLGGAAGWEGSYIGYPPRIMQAALKLYW